jgi:thiamine phosphate synthase YjbQ (UPF0047 family)
VEDIFAFADDTFIPRTGKKTNELVVDMERSIEAITKVVKQSGLKISESKTEICAFHKHDVAPLHVRTVDEVVLSKDSINVLGDIFDTKLTWSHHIQSAVNKSTHALNAFK